MVVQSTSNKKPEMFNSYPSLILFKLVIPFIANQ